MNRILVAALSLLAVQAVPRAARADVKIGTVDVQRAVMETEDGKRTTAKLKTDFEKKQQELNQRQDEIKKMKDDLDKQAKSGVTDPSKLQAKQQELATKFQQLQDTYARLQRDLQDKEGQEMQRMEKKMTSVIHDIAQQEGLTYVLDQRVVLYGPPSQDITNEVIRKYNSTK